MKAKKLLSAALATALGVVWLRSGADLLGFMAGTPMSFLAFAVFAALLVVALFFGLSFLTSVWRGATSGRGKR